MKPPAHARHELLLAAALYLMTRFQAQRCPCIARAVVEHLDQLSREAEQLPVLLRSVCAQLEADWRALAFDAAASAVASSSARTH